METEPDNEQNLESVIEEKVDKRDLTPSTTTESESDVVIKTRFGQRSKTSTLFVGLGVSALILVLLLVFILENLQSVPIDFLGLKGKFPLGVALLFSAVGGVLLTTVLGALRIIQLRLRARRLRIS